MHGMNATIVSVSHHLSGIKPQVYPSAKSRKKGRRKEIGATGMEHISKMNFQYAIT